MSPVKDFNLVYEAINEEGTFSEGDTITGTVSFSLTKNTKVKSLFVKAKGDAHVQWSEGSGDDRKSYSSHRRYFKVKEHLVSENAQGTALPEGLHQFQFTLKIPEGDMPSSFDGPCGKIAYVVEAKICRSWRCPSTLTKEINFITKSFPNTGPVMCPQSGSVTKELGTFSHGQVEMSATVNRKVCSPGDTISVDARVCNTSSKEMKPKFSLQQKTVYRTSNKNKVSDKSLVKMVEDTITPNSEVTTACQVKIPDDAISSLHNCEIISVEYYLKVYLDISFAFDPEVLLPLVVLPSKFVSMLTDEDMGPYPPGAAGAPSDSDFPPPTLPVGPDPAPTGPGPAPSPAPDPTEAHNHKQGLQTATQSSPSLPVQHPAPTAPPHFQLEEDPQSYSAFNLPSYDPLGTSESDHKS